MSWVRSIQFALVLSLTAGGLATRAAAAINYETIVSAYDDNPTAFNAAGVKVKLFNDNLAGYANGATQGNANGGGEFRVQVVSDGTFDWGGATGAVVTTGAASSIPNDWIWETFCVEMNEHISLNTAYSVTIDSVVHNRGGGLNAGTQLLYGLYFEGRLDDIADVGGKGQYYYHTNASANDWASGLQLAIWKLEGFSVTLTSHAQALYNFANSNLNDTSFGIGSLEGNVQVLNLWDGATSKQSQLVYIPAETAGGETPAVPEPASCVVWAVMALAASGCAARRRLAA